MVERKGKREKSIVSTACVECGDLKFDTVAFEGKRYCLKCWVEKFTGLNRASLTKEELWGKGVKNEQ